MTTTTATTWAEKMNAVLAGELDDALNVSVEVCNLAAQVDDSFPLEWWQGIGAQLGVRIDIANWRGEALPEQIVSFAKLVASDADFAAGLAGL